ncbi:MAG TPA: hypothetical protein VJL89_12070, partial [Thermodesulfovibrionia bacterium]|nr:hypothetical protein [Thermodesulfovibrionia bacterium]
GVKDFDVLTIASKQNRVLVTHDYHTMPRYFGIFITTKQSSGVIIVSQKMPITQVVDELIMIWLLSEADEWVNRIVMLPL